MRLIRDGEKTQVLETDTPGEYVVVSMTMAKLPDSGEMIPVQDVENPLCVAKFGTGLTVDDLAAIIADRGGNDDA